MQRFNIKVQEYKDSLFETFSFKTEHFKKEHYMVYHVE